MKKMPLALLVGAALIFSAGSALAADTASVDVTATVLGTCSFDSPNYSMDFGSINTTDTGAHTATANVAFTCSNGTPYTLSDISGARTLTGGVTATSLPYTISGYALGGTGNGISQTVAINGSIAQGDYSVAQPDVYTESINITINP